ARAMLLPPYDVRWIVDGIRDEEISDLDGALDAGSASVDPRYVFGRARPPRRNPLGDDRDDPRDRAKSHPLRRQRLHVHRDERAGRGPVDVRLSTRARRDTESRAPLRDPRLSGRRP